MHSKTSKLVPLLFLATAACSSDSDSGPVESHPPAPEPSAMATTGEQDTPAPEPDPSTTTDDTDPATTGVPELSPEASMDPEPLEMPEPAPNAVEDEPADAGLDSAPDASATPEIEADPMSKPEAGSLDTGNATSGDVPPDGGQSMPDDELSSEFDGPEPGLLRGITAAHNYYRSLVDTDPPLQPLEWDEAIASVAQDYAEVLATSCGGLVHSMGAYGENLYATSTTAAMSDRTGINAVSSWYELELPCYTYGPIDNSGSDCSSECDNFGGCGHYTQVIWRDTERVGCGTAECTDGQWLRSYYVCNYDPPGNWIGQYPY
jgi:pathogenesis-related protein 1